MSIKITESTATNSREVTIRNRSVLLSLGILAFLVLTYGTLISLVLYTMSDIQSHLIGSLWSITLNSVCAVLFTNFLLYFSIYKTTVSREGNQIKVRSFGLLPGISSTSVLQEEVRDIIVTKIGHLFTENYSVTLTFLLNNSRRRSNTFSLPKQSIDESLKMLYGIIGMQKEQASNI